MSPLNSQGTGSTGTLNSERIRRLFLNFKLRLPEQQTSAQFNTDWAARSVRYLEPQLDYGIPGQFGSNSSSWYRYMRERYTSTHAADAAHQPTTARPPHPYSLPSPTWRDLSTRLPSYTTLGNSDAAIGRRVFDLWSTSDLYKYEGFELLLAWGGRGINSSAGVGSSVRLV